MNTKTEVRYYSKTGNTAKLAERIAKTAGCKAKTIEVPLTEQTDILFIGASVYKAGIDKAVKDFIASLDSTKIKKVVIFSTSAFVERAYPEIRKYLSEKGISVASEDFYCRGQFTLLHRGRPNEQDLMDAEAFTKKIMQEA